MAEVTLLSEQASERAVFRRTLPYLRPHRGPLSGALAVALACSASLVLMAPLIGRAADALVDRDRAGLQRTVVLLIGLVVAQIVLTRWSELLLMKAGEQVVRDLRERAVTRLATAPLRFLEAHRRGDLLRRTTGEVTDLARFVRRDLPNLLVIAVTLVLTTGMLLVYSWLLTLVLAVVFVPPAVLVMRSFHRDAEAAFGAQAATEATAAAAFTETLRAREVLQQSGGMAAWLARFRRDNDAVVAAARGTARVEVRIELVSLIEGAALTVLLGLGAWLVSVDRITVGTVVVFVLASRSLFEGLGDGSQLIGDLQTARTGLARLLDLLDGTAAADGRPPVKAPERGPVSEVSVKAVERGPARPASEAPVIGGPVTGTTGSRSPRRGDLCATGLTYLYREGSPVLHGVSIEVPVGERVAVVGTTGAGKTTLGKLLAGLYAPDGGQVTYCGTDLRDIPADELSRRIALVPQDVHIVTGSIADNLRLVPGDPGDAEIERALDRLGLTGWRAALPAGLETPAGARGESLSAGERQIIGLIRAALVDPAVLILDEATADIDPITAGWLEAALAGLCTERSLIVIAHRPATVALLPRVVRLADGRVVEDISKVSLT